MIWLAVLLSKNTEINVMVNTYTYTFIYNHMYVCIYIHTKISIHTEKHIHINTYTHIYITYIYINIHTYKNICTYNTPICAHHLSGGIIAVAYSSVPLAHECGPLGLGTRSY